GKLIEMSGMRRSLVAGVSSSGPATSEPLRRDDEDLDPEGILARRLRLFEVSASGLRRGAVLAEVADVLTAKVLEGVWTAEEAQPLVDWAAETGGVELEEARLGIFLDATNNARSLGLFVASR